MRHATRRGCATCNGSTTELYRLPDERCIVGPCSACRSEEARAFRAEHTPRAADVVEAPLRRSA